MVRRAAPAGLETVSLHNSGPSPAASIYKDMEIGSNLGVQRTLSVVPSADDSGVPSTESTTSESGVPSIEVTEADSSPRHSRRDGLRPVRNINIGSKPMRWEERRKASAERQYGMRISVNKALMSLGKKARDSICKELVGLHNIKCWRPIRYKSLSTKQKKKTIRSFMFLKEKYNSEGEDFDKLKSRLVAGGSMQDRSEYTEAETSSPTVSLSSVYMVAAIAAKENRKVGTADVRMAFLNSKLDREVIMNLEPRLASILVEELPCDITAHTVLLHVLFCLIYMYCTLYVLYILYTVHTVHVPCFPVSDVEVSLFNICSSHLFTLCHIHILLHRT